MKDIYQVLREKELAVARVRQEVEALRFCAPMLAEAAESSQNPARSNDSAAASRRPAELESRNPSNPYQN